MSRSRYFSRRVGFAIFAAFWLASIESPLRAQLGEFDFTLWTFKENDHA